MAQPGDIYINDMLMSPFGRRFTKRIRENARSERTVNGRLIKDIRWRKWEFSLDYSLCDGTTLATYQYLWDLRAALSFRWVDSGGADRSYTVQMGPFDVRRLILLGDGLWSGLSISLEEV